MARKSKYANWDGALIESMSIPEPNSGCWLWLGGVDSFGYGRFRTPPKPGNKTCFVSAHRASFECFNGAIPEGNMVRHQCDVPSCVNPQHLISGTAKQNSADMVKRNRHRFGAQNPQAKLSEQKVATIKARLRAGERPPTIFSDYGVCIFTVYQIAQGKIWQHVL